MKNIQEKLIPLCLVGLYLGLMLCFHKYLRPDQLFLVMALAAVTVLGRQEGKRFVIDWAPFTLFIILYDGMRGVADQAFSSVHVQGPYDLEMIIFGWLTGDKPLPFILQNWKQGLHGSALKHFLDAMSGMFYTAHFLVPFILGWIIWHTYRDRKGFYAFAYTLTLLNVMALITFFVYPAAPPWYVWKYQFISPHLTGVHLGDPAALVNVDKLLRFPLFKSVYGALNPNPFAAIPSLHGAYPMVIAFFASRRWKNIFVRIVLVIYVLLTWFAAVYLNHHYVVDLLIGAAYVTFALIFCRKILMPRIIEPLVFRKSATGHEPISVPQKTSLVHSVLFGLGGFVLVALLLLYAKGKI